MNRFNRLCRPFWTTLSLTTLIFTQSLVADSQNTYERLSSALLVAETKVNQAQEVKLGTGNEQVTAKEPETIFTVDLSVGQMSEYDQMRHWIALQKTVTPDLQISEADLDTAVQLSAIRGTKSDLNHTLLKHGLRLQTTAGLLKASLHLLRDVSDQEIRNRQAVVKYFVEHPAELEKLKQAFEDIKTGQGTMTLLFKATEQSEALAKQTIDGFFIPFGEKIGLNKNLAATTAWRALWTGINGIGYIPPVIYLKAWDKCKQGCWEAFTNQNNSNLRALGKSAQSLASLPYYMATDGVPYFFNIHNPFPSVLKGKTADLISPHFVSMDVVEHGTLGDRALLAQSMEMTPSAKVGNPTAKHYLLASIEPAIYGVLWAWYGQLAHQFMKVQKNALNHLCTKLHAVARVTRGLKAINEIAQQSQLPELAQFAQKTSVFIAAENNKDLATFFSYLTRWEDDAYATPESLGKTLRNIAFGGHLLVSYTLLNEQKQTFIEPMLEAGDIEILCRAAERVIEGQNNPEKPWCFTTLLGQETPGVQVNLTGFWNTLTTKSTVTNDLDLGTENTKNINIHGSNGFGKSTIAKAVPHAIYFTKLAGITPARTAQMHNVKRVRVYLKEEEDVAAGKSTFMSQKSKLDALVNEIESSNESTLIFLDEALTGTTHELGISLALDIVRRLIKQPYVTLMSAFHAKEAIDLEKETDGRMVNYYVVTIENLDKAINDPERFSRPFKIQRGVDMSWFEDLQKSKRCVTWLLAQQGAQ